MSEDQTVWSRTLLQGFIAGMRDNPDKEWIQQQAQELNERGMSTEYLYHALCKDINEEKADLFLSATGATLKSSDKKPEKKGLFSRLFS